MVTVMVLPLKDEEGKASKEALKYIMDGIWITNIKKDEHLYQIVEGCYPRQRELHLNYEPTILKQMNWFADQDDTQALVIYSGDVFTKLHYAAGSASFQFVVEGKKHYICVPFDQAEEYFKWESKKKQQDFRRV